MVSSRIVLAAAASLAALATAAPVETRDTCYSGVYVIAGRGSEEDPGQGSTQQVTDLITAAIPGSGSVAVDYPASVFDPPYPSSVSDGITDVINKIHSYVDSCGGRIVLVGFSQGGNVMTDVLAGGVDKPDPIDSYYASFIRGVTVFGDPSFTANQTFDVGTSTSDGIFARDEGGDSLALLNTYASIVRSYCNEGDVYCASGDDSDVHGQEVPTYKQQAANFVVSLNS